jgi:hypothetical protein
MTSSKPFTFYVNPAWRRSGAHVYLLNPLWGNPYEKTSIFSRSMFDSYSPDTSCYAITEVISEADAVLAPYNHNWMLRSQAALLEECRRTAQEHRLPLVIDGSGDAHNPAPDENTYMLRYGGYRFMPEPRTVHIPLMVDDLLERCEGGQLRVRRKSSNKPVIGFAGWAHITWKQQLRRVIKGVPGRLRGIYDARYRACAKGIIWRQRALSFLRHSPRITTNFRLRSSFSANPKTAIGDMKQLRREMADTILDSDYALDVRGDANNSARLFEILSLGRIPVIVDTERIFPFSDEIDYSSFAIVVDFRDINRLPDIVADFHWSVSSEKFEEMQRNARQAFVRYFRIDAMTRHIIKRLSHTLQYN